MSFQIKHRSWEIKNFVPKEEPEVPLLMAGTEQQLSAADDAMSAGDDDDDDDDELGRMCNGLLGDDHPQLSPLTVVDKSALADDTSIVGMSHNIDDVVDSVINHDDLPPLADLAVLPPPLLTPAHKPAVTALNSAESTPMPKLESEIPGVAYVNNEPKVVVRFRRLNIHRYCSPDTAQCDTMASVNAVEPLNITFTPETASKSSESLSTLDGADIIKHEPVVSTSKQKQNVDFVVSKLHKSVSVKRGSGSEKSPVKTCMSAVVSVRRSPVVVMTELSAEALRSAGHCSQLVTERSTSASCESKSSSVKRKSDTAVPSVSHVKKQRTDVVAMPTSNNSTSQQYVVTDYCSLMMFCLL